MIRHFISVIILFFGHLAVLGYDYLEEVSICFLVSSDTIDMSLNDNAEKISDILALFEKNEDSDTIEIKQVTFTGSASPEGSYTYNRRLASARRTILKNYVLDRYLIPDSLVHEKKSVIEWPRLISLIEASDMPYKQEALRVMRTVPESVYDKRGRLIDSRQKQLMELRAGRTWHYMSDHFFGSMRNAEISVLMAVHKHTPPQEPEPPIADTIPEAPTIEEIIVAEPLDTTTVVTTVEMTSGQKTFFMSAKTNMLYDILALPNIGAEFYLGKNWSLTADWMYGWWSNDKRHHYWRAYGGGISLRRWFGKAAARKPLTGHHIGVYGQILIYDFEFGGKGQMAGTPGKSIWSNPSYATGIDYGYSLALSRRFNIDFTIGIGYLGGKYYEYIPIDNHYVWQATKQRHWFGPTKAEVSLVWLLGRNNINDKK